MSIKNLVLLGGGHTHVVALRNWQTKPLANVNLSLICDTVQTPYSGMLPGHIAGYYTFKQTHIDLVPLTQGSKAKLILDRAVGLDLEQNQVICQSSARVNFDFLSIDIGSTPDTSNVRGAAQYAIPAKPVPNLLAHWQKILSLASHNPDRNLSLSIVGGGAGGVELALNMHSRLTKILAGDRIQIHLFQRSKRLLPNHNDWVGYKLTEILQQRGIELHLQTNVIEVLPQQIICDSGLRVRSDYIFWVTRASAPPWLKESGLSTDERGFILVTDTLQSISHPHIFAAGDIATMVNYRLPKAGVFAVRQGKPLGENLRRILRHQPLISYIPQKSYLSLIGTGDRHAIASWGYLGWESPLLWYWKDYLDRQFMA